jgi:hypothetical protein
MHLHPDPFFEFSQREGLSLSAYFSTTVTRGERRHGILSIEAPVNIPKFAGVCSQQEAMKPGLPVHECVARLKRYHYALKRLHQILTSHITAEPVYELKMIFSHQAYLCAEHVSALRGRVAEMREPPLGLDQVPDPNLEIFFDELLSAPEKLTLALGVYAKAIPALQEALAQHIVLTNPLVDAPSVRVCRLILFELADIASVGQQVITGLQESRSIRSEADPANELQAWLEYLDELLSAAGGLAGADAIYGQSLPRRFSAFGYAYDPIPRRDKRFQDPYNMGVNAEAFIYDPRYPARAKLLMLYYKRLREIDVPEMMASILAETKDKPWEYTHDMSRQLWDEARHALMGEAGFLSHGLDWSKLACINFTWSLALNTQLQAWERHAVLYFIEQGLMPRTGKRFEWEIADQAGDQLAKLFQDYDWADEVLHARIGQEWYVSAMPNRAEAVKYGDACWSKVFMNYDTWLNEGLTQHDNWWPALYLAACEIWGETPDPQTLAFHETYQGKRADLKGVNA